MVSEDDLVADWRTIRLLLAVRLEPKFILFFFLGGGFPLPILRRRHWPDLFAIVIVILLLLFNFHCRLWFGRLLDVSWTHPFSLLTSSARLLCSSLAFILTDTSLVFLPKLIGSPNPSMMRVLENVGSTETRDSCKRLGGGIGICTSVPGVSVDSSNNSEKQSITAGAMHAWSVNAGSQPQQFNSICWA
jgi:hypothetical protein